MTKQRRFALEARAADIVAALVASLPRRAALALGRGLGRIWADLDRRHVRIAADNLRHAFPHWDDARVLRTARGVYVHFGAMLLDVLWLGQRTPAEIVSLVDFEGEARVAEAFALGKGVLLLTGHFGNWEVAGLAQGYRFGSIGVVARVLDNPALDSRLCAFRALTGNTVIYKQRALQQVLRFLREGKGVAFLIDQNVQEGGIFVDFFGRPAATATVVAALALKTGAPVVACFAEMLPNGRYRFFYEKPVHPVASGDRARDVAQLTQRLTAIVESAIRARPEQWLWLHRRWKTRPGSSPDQPASSGPNDGFEAAASVR